MELKPIKKEKEILYPTAKEVTNLDKINETTVAVKLQDMKEPVICYVAVPSHMPKVKEYENIREISIILVICSFILLFTNFIEKLVYKKK